MKRYLKICSVAFLAGVGAARVLIWLNMGIVHLLVMRGGWEMAAAVKAAPWILLALGRRSDLQHCRDACRQQAL